MFNEKMEKALNNQINAEYFSAYLYLAMAAYFESINLPGFANWTRVQVQEETSHAMKLFDFICERGGRAMLDAIEKPASEWESPEAAFEAIYEHECYISGRINELVSLSLEEKDHASNNMLQWFVAEQVEEEATADGILQQVKRVGNDGPGIYLIDMELAKRVFTPPAAADSAGA